MNCNTTHYRANSSSVPGDPTSVHAGLWTSAALAAAPRDVPVLRAALATLKAKFGFDPRGHAGKALTHAMGTLPHDLTVAFDRESLERLALTAMSLADRPRPEGFFTHGTFEARGGRL